MSGDIVMWKTDVFITSDRVIISVNTFSVSSVLRLCSTFL